MTTLATLIRHAEEPDVYGYVGPTAGELRAASQRVRITADSDGRLVAAVDGEPRFRTDTSGCGLWRYGHGSEDGTWYDGHGTWTPVQSWHQILGTGQISGREALRSYVVEQVAAELSCD